MSWISIIASCCKKKKTFKSPQHSTLMCNVSHTWAWWHLINAITTEFACARTKLIFIHLANRERSLRGKEDSDVSLPMVYSIFGIARCEANVLGKRTRLACVPVVTKNHDRLKVSEEITFGYSYMVINLLSPTWVLSLSEKVTSHCDRAQFLR